MSPERDSAAGSSGSKIGGGVQEISLERPVGTDCSKPCSLNFLLWAIGSHRELKSQSVAYSKRCLGVFV